MTVLLPCRDFQVSWESLPWLPTQCRLSWLKIVNYWIDWFEWWKRFWLPIVAPSAARNAKIPVNARLLSVWYSFSLFFFCKKWMWRLPTLKIKATRPQLPANKSMFTFTRKIRTRSESSWFNRVTLLEIIYTNKAKLFRWWQKILCI